MSKIIVKNFIKFFFLSAISLLFCCAERFMGDENSSLDFRYDNLVVEDFVKGSDDIPLLKNMEIIENKAVSFDSENSSFTSVAYKALIESDVLKDFYLHTLPEMGWILEKNNFKEQIFYRENDKVKIEFISSDLEGEGDLVIFSISSNNK